MNKKDEESEPTPEEIELVVTQEGYEAGLKRGWTDDDMLKPGRYKMKRGGFLKRHPELQLNEKSRPRNAEGVRYGSPGYSASQLVTQGDTLG